MNIVLYSIVPVAASVPTGVGFALAVLALMILSKSAGAKSSATVRGSVSRSYVACIIGVDLACLIFNEEQVQQTNKRDVTDTSEIPLKSFMDIATDLVSNQEVIEGTILRVGV
ncbi:MAG TPA: hypothetical protein VK638_07485, partial [Edaphobacter sp.]|nr:hypothetical protein [Edaphobacter sp.]